MSNSVHFNHAICGNPSLQARIERLLPLIEKRVRRIQSAEYTTEDLVNFGVIKLLEKATSDSTFERHADAYWINAATWAARHAAERSYTYIRHVSQDGEIIDENGEAASMIEEFYYDLEVASPEEALLEKEAVDIQHAQMKVIMQVINTLSDGNRKIVQMLLQGYTQDEIARIMGLTKGTISQHKRAILTTLGRAIANAGLL